MLEMEARLNSAWSKKWKC